MVVSRDVARTNEFHLPIRVYYEDTDAGGVVYHANYLCFMERTRTEWLRQLGFEQDELIKTEGLVFAVRGMTIEYLKPARFNELLDVSVTITELRGASLRAQQDVRNQSGEILCQADVRIACVDANTLKPRPIPKTLFPELNHVG
jgi:acyl-CoA thioester hydrolase